MDDRTINADVTMRGGDAGVLGSIDQYEIVRELGEGGFGSVYLARDTVAGVEVAIKGLPPEVKHNRAEMENVKANFALVSRLHHPYIAAALHLHPAKNVSYVDTTVRDRLRVMPGDAFLVMEYAPGVTLDRWRKQFPNGIVPLEMAANIAWQVAQALDFAHENHILHRDVKPANVMIETTSEGEVIARLLDFGLAAEIRSSMGRVSREIRDTSGTRPYMAPEQWAGRKQTAATDQYALAAMLYELIVGEVPFASVFETGDPVIMMTVVTGRDVEVPADCPRRGSLIKALSKNGGDRYVSCMEFIQAFAKSEKPQAAASADAQAPKSARRIVSRAGFSRLGRRPGMLAAIALVAVVVGIWMAVSSHRQSERLAEIRERIAGQKSLFVAECDKAFEFRRDPGENAARLARIDEWNEEVASFFVPHKAETAERQLSRITELVSAVRMEVSAMRVTQERRKENERKANSAQTVHQAELEKKQETVVRTTPADDKPVIPAMERMKSARLPKVAFSPPSTMSDVVEFFRSASRDYDSPDIPLEKRGIGILLLNDVVDGKARLTTSIKLNDVPLLQALQMTCSSNGFACDVTNGVVIVRKVAGRTATAMAKKVPVAERNPSMREATHAAKRAAQNYDWQGCYGNLKYADTNDCEIMYLYGVCLSSHHPEKKAGIPKNDRRAFNWFLRGAKRGDAPCQYNLGEAYRKGQGIAKDVELAGYWIKKAAEQGNPDAVCSLAEMLESGEAGQKDLEKAADLYSLAAQQRVARAEKWVREHKAAGRYEKMVAKQKKEVSRKTAADMYDASDYTPRRRSSWSGSSYGGSWSPPSTPSVSGGSSNAAVWGSVLGGVLTGLAIGLSAVH